MLALGGRPLRRVCLGGQRPQGCHLAAGLVGYPAVVFLDEPTTGLDPVLREEAWRMIRALAGDGVTIMLTTQYLEEADALADRICVIDHGKVIAAGMAARCNSAWRPMCSQECPAI